MIRSRCRFSCHVHPLTQQLYAIGGYNDLIINTSKIRSNEWSAFSDLPIRLHSHRSLIYKDLIIVISGYDNTNGRYNDQILLID